MVLTGHEFMSGPEPCFWEVKDTRDIHTTSSGTALKLRWGTSSLKVQREENVEKQTRGHIV